MSYKTILAYLACPDSVDDVMSIALPLAEKHKAHLTGLHVFTGVPVIGTIGAQVPAEIIEQYAQNMREDADAIAAAFATQTKGPGVPTEWRCHEEKTVGADILTSISEQVRCADLVVMGQSDSEQRVGELTADIIISAGRPAIVVPQGSTNTDLSGPIAVAWDGSRESARAAFDALPLLKEAKSVFVVTAERKEEKDAIAQGGGDLALALARHDIEAEATVIQAKSSVGEELLKFAGDQKCSLLVMGCYGHSRLRERLFGGATRGVLQDMTLPIFMSH